jgi:hypothetical protein
VQLKDLALLFLWNLPPYWYSDPTILIGTVIDRIDITCFWLVECATPRLWAFFFAAHGADKEGHTLPLV